MLVCRPASTLLSKRRGHYQKQLHRLHRHTWSIKSDTNQSPCQHEKRSIDTFLFSARRPQQPHLFGIARRANHDILFAPYGRIMLLLSGFSKTGRHHKLRTRGKTDNRQQHHLSFAFYTLRRPKPHLSLLARHQLASYNRAFAHPSTSHKRCCGF